MSEDTGKDTSPTPLVDQWFDDDVVRATLGNSIVALSLSRRLRYGRKFRETVLRNFAQGMVESLRVLLSTDDNNKPIPPLLTDEELAFALQTAVMLILTPAFSESQQVALVRSIKKGQIQRVKGEK